MVNIETKHNQKREQNSIFFEDDKTNSNSLGYGNATQRATQQQVDYLEPWFTRIVWLVYNKVKQEEEEAGKRFDTTEGSNQRNSKVDYLEPSFTNMSSFFVVAGMVTVGIQGLGFLVAVLLQTEIFYDILGGMNFLTLAVLGYYRLVRVPLVMTTTLTPSSAVYRPLNVCFLFLFTLSRGWLLCFLAWRAHQRKGT